MVKDHSYSKRGNLLHHMGYAFWLAAGVLLYAPSHRQESTYHDLCYTNHGALAGTRNSSIGPPWGIDPTTHRTMNGRSTAELHIAAIYWFIKNLLWVGQVLGCEPSTYQPYVLCINCATEISWIVNSKKVII